MTAQRIGCRHAILAPPCVCTNCGRMVSRMDVAAFVDAERFSMSTAPRWDVERDEDGWPVLLGWTPGLTT